MKKFPKAGFKKWGNLAKGVIVIELLAVGGCYYVWRRMNTERDFRLKMHKDWPKTLEGYYRVGEYMNDSPLRKIDYQMWGVKDTQHLSKPDCNAKRTQGPAT